jgi:hypothetical protein
VTKDTDKAVATMIGKEPILSALKTIDTLVRPVDQKTTLAKDNHNPDLKRVKMRIKSLEPAMAN